MALSEPYRSTIVHRFFHGHTPNEIAAAAGVPLKTVESRITRALRKLRTRLDHVHGDRRAWCAALAPLVWPRKAVAATAVAGVLVATKLKLAAVAAAILIAGAGVWAVRPPHRETDTRAERAVAITQTLASADPTVDARAAIEPASRGAANSDRPSQEPKAVWASGVISGRVVTSDGKPFPEGAGISLTGPIVHERDLAKDGAFRFTDLIEGSYTLIVDADGYAPESVYLTLSEKDSPAQSLTLTLGPGSTIRYRMRSLDGTPVGNLPFELSGERVNFIFNTPDGEHSLPHLAKGSYTIWFTHGGQEHQWAIRLVRDRDVDIEIVPDAEVVGTVRDALGRPLPDVSVSFAGTVIQAPTVTDKDGRYRLVGLAPGVYGITVTGDGFAAWGGRRPIARVARTKHDISLEPGSLRGRVRGIDKRPWIQLAGPIALMTRANENSEFSFWGLPAGSYKLKPTGPSPFAAPILEFALRDGEERDNIEVHIGKQKFGYLEIEVRGPDGALTEPKGFVVTDGFVSTSMASESIAFGRSRLRLEAGRRIIHVFDQNDAQARLEVVIVEGQTIHRRVKTIATSVGGLTILEKQKIR